MVLKEKLGKIVNYGATALSAIAFLVGMVYSETKKRKVIKMKLSDFKYLIPGYVFWSGDWRSDKNFPTYLQAITNMSSTAAFIFASIAYGAYAYDHKELNPKKLLDMVRNENRIARAENERYTRLWGKLFGKDGYADKNKDGVITFPELSDVLQRTEGITNRKTGFENYRHQGLNYQYLNITLSPSLTANDLEKVVQSYEAERR